MREFSIKANKYFHHPLGGADDSPSDSKGTTNGSFPSDKGATNSVSSAEELEEEPERDAEFKFNSIKKSQLALDETKKSNGHVKAADSGDDDDAKEDDDDKIEEPGMKKPSGKYGATLCTCALQYTAFKLHAACLKAVLLCILNVIPAFL